MVLLCWKKTQFLLTKWMIILSPENDRGIAFDDPGIDINWLVEQDKIQLSGKDKQQPLLSEALSSGDIFDIGESLYN